MTSIASNAFSGRDGIKIIADNAFTAAAKFASDNGYELELRDSDADFEIVDGVLKGYHGTKTDIVIPSTVTEIGEGVFVTEEGEEGVEITKVTIPSSVVKIGKDAFNGCELTSVILRVKISPKSVNRRSLTARSFLKSRFRRDLKSSEKRRSRARAR